MQGWPGWQLALLVYSIAFIFLFTLLHETTHDTPFASRRLGRVVGALCGFALFLPLRWFTYFHLAHHRFTQDPDRDPELAEGKPQSLWDYAVYLSGLPVWWSQIRQLLRNVAGVASDDFVPEKRRAEIHTEARVHIALYMLVLLTGIYFTLSWLVWLWLVPALIGQPFLRAYLLAEHTGCAYVSNMLENTRTTFTGRFIRFIAWNMPYHTEHHAYPAVPFHKLPDLHRAIAGDLKVTEKGYVSFHRKLVASLSR
jgi:fatty acid desaturase